MYELWYLCKIAKWNHLFVQSMNLAGGRWTDLCRPIRPPWSKAYPRLCCRQHQSPWLQPYLPVRHFMHQQTVYPRLDLRRQLPPVSRNRTSFCRKPLSILLQLACPLLLLVVVVLRPSHQIPFKGPRDLLHKMTYSASISMLLPRRRRIVTAWHNQKRTSNRISCPSFLLKVQHRPPPYTTLMPLSLWLRRGPPRVRLTLLSQRVW